MEILTTRGLSLSWAQYVGDDRAQMTELLRRTFATGDVVFSTGGIGATPDDHTRQSAAVALGEELVAHPEAVALLHERIAAQAAEGQVPADLEHPENRQRLRMTEFPASARIIPNPVNQIAGFGVADHWFVPGFPKMASPMIEWVLDTHYRDAFHTDVLVDRGLRILGVPESAVAPWMEAVERDHPGVRSYSLPSTRDGRPFIELGVKGGATVVEAAFAQLRAAAEATGAPVEVS